MELLRAAASLEVQRFESQDIARRAIDERYGQRFIDSEKAVSAALAAAKEAVNAALAAADRAVTKAEDASNKRFDGVNEFRKSLSDLSATMMTRIESEQRFKGIEDKIGTLVAALDSRLLKTEKFQSERAGAMAQGDSSKNQSMWAVGILVSIVLAAAAIAVAFVHHG